jgi:hypothetical protein
VPPIKPGGFEHWNKTGRISIWTLLGGKFAAESRAQMKTMLLAGTALMLVAGANLSPAMAQATSPARWDASQATAQPVERGARDTVMPSPRYEYQYGGSPRHPHWEPQRLPVE